MFYPNEGALKLASAVRTELASAELRLYKFGLSVSGATTLADLDAEECDFTGYAAIVVTWNAAGLNPAGGASFQCCAQFNTASPYTVANTVGGFYLVDVTGTDAVFTIQEFPTPGIPMGAAGDILPLIVVLVFGTPAA